MNNKNYTLRKRHIYFAIFILVLWITFIFYSLIAALPTNAMNISKNTENRIMQIYPQGWGFFSKDPRSENTNVYRMDEIKLAANWPNNSVENAFGIYRKGRGQGVELGLITGELPMDKEWQECSKGTKECLREIKESDVITVTNTTPNPTLCGQLGLANESLVPWAWSKYSKDHISKDSEVLRVNVLCEK